jgi:HAD superfamily hydrolase (TIGR01509 family)
MPSPSRDHPAAAAVVDVDGTLVDSSYLVTVAWARALAENGHTVPMARIHRLIGMSGSRLVEELLGRAEPPVLEAHQRHYEPLRREVRRLPGAADLLRSLAGRGIAVVLATSAKPEELDDLLRVLDADDAIHEVVCARDVERSKPDPDPFARALEAAGVGPERAVALGDSVWDVEAARRCELRCVGVTTGGISEQELRDAGAVAVFADAGALAAGLDESPFGALAAPAERR